MGDKLATGAAMTEAASMKRDVREFILEVAGYRLWIVVGILSVK